MTAAARDHDPLYDPDEVVTLHRADILSAHQPPSNAYSVAVATGRIPEPDPPPSEPSHHTHYRDGRPRHRRAPRHDRTILGIRALAATLFTGMICGLVAFTRVVIAAPYLSTTGVVLTAVFVLALCVVAIGALLKLITVHPCPCGTGYTNGRP